MSGYTEILQSMLAIVLVSLLIINANRAIVVNNAIYVEGSLEDQVIAIAQDYIDESRTTTFDAFTGGGNVPVNIPGGFTGANSLGPGAGENSRDDFSDFDDYNGWNETILASDGVEYDISISVSYYQNGAVINSKSTLKQMIITISSDQLKRNSNNSNNVYTFKFLRSFYAD